MNSWLQITSVGFNDLFQVFGCILIQFHHGEFFFCCCSSSIFSILFVLALVRVGLLVLLVKWGSHKIGGDNTFALYENGSSQKTLVSGSHQNFGRVFRHLERNSQGCMSLMAFVIQRAIWNPPVSYLVTNDMLS